MKEVVHYLAVFAAAALVIAAVFWAVQRRKSQPLPYWVSLVIEVAIGMLAGFVAYHVTHEGQKPDEENLFRELGTFLIHTLFVMIVLEMGRSAHKLENTERSVQRAFEQLTKDTNARLDKVDQTVADSCRNLATSHSQLTKIIDNDQRIILARSEPLEARKEVAVLGVERLDRGELPTPLKPPDKGTKWEETISVLRFDRLQDLLFSTEYLRHFFELSRATKHQYRLLIINDTPRSEVAIRSFLEMSDRLDIPTYVHLKGHFYRMLSTLEAVLPKADAEEVCLVLQGQPELSTIFDPRNGTFTEDNYLLRFRVDHGKGPVRAYGRNQGPHKSLDRIKIIHKIMQLGIRDEERKGLDHLAGVLRNNRTDPWSRESLEAELNR